MNKFQILLIFALLSIEACAQDSTNIVLYTEVEELPRFNPDLEEYIHKNLEWPHPEMTISGKVIISFVVDKEGKVRDVQIERGLCEKCDNNVKKVFNNMPDWKPGKVNDKTVNVKMFYPIHYKISP